MVWEQLLRKYCVVFQRIGKKLTTLKFRQDYGKDDEIVTNNVSRLLGNPKVNCDDFVLSGQCIIANFGFVREQGMHMNYDTEDK